MLEMYIDGCYNTKTNTYGYGVVVVYEGKKLHMKSFKGTPDKVQFRNVAGEVDASIYAMKYAQDNGYSSVTIYTDYEGVIKWCTGEWKAKNSLTQYYRDLYLELSSSIDIKFVKIKSHTGHPLNELADSLAKKGAGKL